MTGKTSIAMIGGTGKSGKYVVNELLKLKIPIKMLLRNPLSYPNPGNLIEIVQGDARDYKSIKNLLIGCKAVISTLGQPRGEGSIFSDATRNILRAMKEFNIRRYIVTTGLNVDAPSDNKSEKVKAATEWMYANYPNTTKDKQMEFEVLSASDLDWTLIRLPMIELTDEHRKTSVNLEDCPGDKISASDLATFIVQQLDDTRYVRKAPFIAND